MPVTPRSLEGSRARSVGDNTCSNYRMPIWLPSFIPILLQLTVFLPSVMGVASPGTGWILVLRRSGWSCQGAGRERGSTAGVRADRCLGPAGWTFLPLLI